jgi:tryptophan 2,3-dioxygenase
MINKDAMALTYSRYLQLNSILNAQRQLSPGPEHDEMLFIIIHQTYELWFKEILHEIDYLKILLGKKELSRSLHTIKRILTILKILVGQIDILETMTPLEFLSFRDRLESASGFQSAQFRELEICLGKRTAGMLNRTHFAEEERNKIEQRFTEPTLWDAFIHYLANSGYEIPQQELKRDYSKPITSSSEIKKILVEIYNTDSANAQFCELLVDLDEGFQEWRYRHIKMVQRTIGTKKGTGGSDGVEYLMKTLNQPFFPDLWEIRTELKK